MSSALVQVQLPPNDPLVAFGGLHSWRRTSSPSLNPLVLLSLSPGSLGEFVEASSKCASPAYVTFLGTSCCVYLPSWMLFIYNVPRSVHSLCLFCEFASLNSCSGQRMHAFIAFSTSKIGPNLSYPLLGLCLIDVCKSFPRQTGTVFVSAGTNVCSSR